MIKFISKKVVLCPKGVFIGFSAKNELNKIMGVFKG